MQCVANIIPFYIEEVASIMSTITGLGNAWMRCTCMAVASGLAGPVLAGPVLTRHFHACACAGDQLTVCSAGSGDAAMRYR